MITRSGATLTLTGGSLAVGDLIFNTNGTYAVAINTSSDSPNSTLTLSGNGGSAAAIAAGGSSGDLLLLGSNFTNTVTIGGNSGSGSARLLVTLGSTGNFNVINSAATANIMAPISGGFGITKRGAGKLILANNNSYTQPTSIEGGTLVANGTMAATGNGLVNIGQNTTAGTRGTLAGTGGVVSASVNAGGTITAGSGATSSDSVGTLTTTNTQTWNGNGTTASDSRGRYVWKLAGGGTTPGTNWDLLQIGTLNIAASGSSKFGLTVVTTAANAFSGINGQSYTIARGTTLLFNNAVPAAASGDITDLFYLNLDALGLSDNDSRFRVTYTTSGGSFAVNLEAAPEPTTAAMMGLAGSVMLTRRRRAVRSST